MENSPYAKSLKAIEDWSVSGCGLPRKSCAFRKASCCRAFPRVPVPADSRTRIPLTWNSYHQTRPRLKRATPPPCYLGNFDTEASTCGDLTIGLGWIPAMSTSGLATRLMWLGCVEVSRFGTPASISLCLLPAPSLAVKSCFVFLQSGDITVSPNTKRLFSNPNCSWWLDLALA